LTALPTLSETHVFGELAMESGSNAMWMELNANTEQFI